MKNNASDTINKITPKFNPFCTANVWLPKYVPSLIISLNQKDIEAVNINKAPKNTMYELLKLCIANAPLVVKVNKLILVYKGHGEGDTK
jgi:hypothetical protein